MEAPSGKPKGFPQFNQQVQQQDAGLHVPWWGGTEGWQREVLMDRETPGSCQHTKKAVWLPG